MLMTYSTDSFMFDERFHVTWKELEIAEMCFID
jgi:hypothetical protein